MKIFLISLIFLNYYGFSESNTVPPDMGKRIVSLSGLVPALNISKQEQFDRALSWFSALRSASVEIINVADPAGGIIQANGFVERAQPGVASRNMYRTTFTIEIRLLDGAYSYKLYNFGLIPFKKDRYCPKQVKFLDSSGIIKFDAQAISVSRVNRIHYQEARRIAELITSSIYRSLSKN